jgi:hypothetical protein
LSIFSATRPSVATLIAEDDAHASLPERADDSVFPEHEIADLGQPPHARRVP